MSETKEDVSGQAKQRAGGDQPALQPAHLFCKHGRTFLFDPCTRTSFELDAAGEAAARELLRETAKPERIGRKELAAARRELHTLQNQGYFQQTQPTLRPLDLSWIGIPMPVISKACNLRCRYCFVNRTGPIHMNREVMEATAAFIAKGAVQFNLSSHTVWIGSVGEPTVYFSQYQEFKAIIEKEGRQHGIKLTAAIPITNATTTDDEAVQLQLQALQLNDHSARISLDGPPEVHNAFRVYPDGRGTYHDVLSGIHRLQKSGGEIKISATLTALFPEVSEVYFHLLDLGVKDVVVKPVRARPEEAHYLGHKLEEICAGYDRLAARLLELSDDRLIAALSAIGQLTEVDYFNRFLLRIVGRRALERRCGSWIARIIADTDGRLYGCESFLGLPEACIGSVWEGVDEARVQELHDSLHISRREPCNQCWARLVCGGGCMHQSYLTFGSFSPPDPAECALNRHLIELAIWFYHELKRERPAILTEFQKSINPTEPNAPA